MMKDIHKGSSKFILLISYAVIKKYLTLQGCKNWGRDLNRAEARSWRNPSLYACCCGWAGLELTVGMLLKASGFTDLHYHTYPLGHEGPGDLSQNTFCNCVHSLYAEVLLRELQSTHLYLLSAGISYRQHVIGDHNSEKSNKFSFETSSRTPITGDMVFLASNLCM